jgi:hypothetical protein
MSELIRNVPFFKKGGKATNQRMARHKTFFDAWIEFGSLSKAANYLNNLGYMVNNGEIKQINVWYAAWVWILNHPEEARPYFEQGYRELTGEEMSEEEWIEELISKATTIFGQRELAFRRWANKNGLLGYTEHYENKFPRTAKQYRDGKIEVS